VTPDPTKDEIKALFERLATAPRRLFEVCSGASPERMRQPIGPGKWTPLQLIQHMVGCDREALLPRIEKMLAWDDPEIPRWDEDQWMRVHGQVHDRKPVSLIDEFARLREKAVVILFDLSVEEWLRTGRHEQFGSITIYSLAQHFADHDDHHQAQIARHLAAESGLHLPR
jgi:uncharacterized damage-inducible protein DinB